MEMPSDWVKNYGPALKISFGVLRFAFAVGRLATCLPMPDLSGVGKSTNLFSVLSDNLALVDGAPDLTELTEIIGDIATLTIPDGSEFGGLTDRTKEIIESSYKEVKKIAKNKGDEEFFNTGLRKVVNNDSIEYVLNDPKIMAIYENMGSRCIGLDHEKLIELGADLDIVVKEGLLEKKSSSKFLRWKQKYFVLRKSMSLTYYDSEEERKKDPLGVRGKAKHQKVVKVGPGDRGESFYVKYEDEKEQWFRVTTEVSNSHAVDATAWVDKIKAHL